MNEILNIFDICNNAVEHTEYINKCFMQFHYGRDEHIRCILGIKDVYITRDILNVILDIYERNSQDYFNEYINVEELTGQYINGFKRGYEEITKDCIPTSISFKEDVFSAATNLYTPFYYDPDNKIIPDNWDKTGYNIGRFYSAWCIILKKQRFFEPLFKEYCPTPENKEDQSESNGKKYRYPTQKIEDLHLYLYPKVVDCTKTEFFVAVATASFSNIEIKKKHALMYSIYAINTYCEMDNGWYSKSAGSIKTTPRNCSGANVTDEFKNGLEQTLKSKKIRVNCK